MVLVDFINEIKFDDIWDLIQKRHPIFNSESFSKLSLDNKKIVEKNSYYTMKNTFVSMQQKECLLDENIIIVVVKEIDPEDYTKERITSYLVQKDEIIEKKKNGNITLWTNENLVNHFSYNFIPWQEILGYKVCPKSLTLSYKEVIAEIFCEMTRFGFDENKIKELNKNISKDLNNLNLMDEITKARKHGFANVDTWFNNLCDKIGLSKAPKEMDEKETQKKIIMENNHKIHLEYIKSII